MKKIILISSLVSSFLFSQYLQSGIYADCAHVIVDEQGWKIHKNRNGKTISMTPKSKHNIEPGKYSFDKFGNLVPFRECDSNDTINTNLDSTEIEVSIQISLFENIDFSVYAGGSMGFGDNLTGQFPIGMNYGADIKYNNFNVSLSGMSSTWDGSNANYDYTWNWSQDADWSYNWSNSEQAKNAKLSTMGVFLGYTLNLGKIFITPSIGMLTQKIDSLPFLLNDEQTIMVQSFDGQDNAIKVDVGYNFGKVSIYAGGTYSLTSNYHWANTEQPAVYFNGGLKYNF
jgi:hypothetical protein|tara:strand:- start:764 stop:1618 length:855 start_codon:yes stop_codon:yes gene_type:complete